MTRPARLPPNGYSRDWPNKRCSDASAQTARQFVVNLTGAIDGRSLRTIGELVGISYSALSRILSGDTWPDLATIAKLEHGLGVGLYPPFRPVD